MKKILILTIILSIAIGSGKPIFAENSSQMKSTQVEKVSYLKVKKIAIALKKPVLPEKMLLDVPLLNQMDQPRLYNGCEVTSLAMILQFNGVNVTKNELAANVKKVPLYYSGNLRGNPNVGFVGDMENGPGLSVYNGPIVDLAKEYVGEKVVNLTNSSFTDLLKTVGQGNPVWIITTTTFTPLSSFQEWDTPQGKINITLNGHSVVITGYDKQYIYINDPFGFKNRKVERTAFIKAWEQMGSQAVVIIK